MQKLLTFSRNRCTSVEQVNDKTIISTSRVQDTLSDAFVELKVKLPDLEIIEITGDFKRTYRQGCKELNASLKKVVGMRVGPGMLKIIKGLIGDGSDCNELAFMVEECCHGVILALNKDMLKQMELMTRGKEITDDLYTEMVKSNIRLYNRCAAFAQGSPLVEGIEPPKGE